MRGVNPGATDVKSRIIINVGKSIGKAVLKSLPIKSNRKKKKIAPKNKVVKNSIQESIKIVDKEDKEEKEPWVVSRRMILEKGHFELNSRSHYIDVTTLFTPFRKRVGYVAFTPKNIGFSPTYSLTLVKFQEITQKINIPMFSNITASYEHSQTSGTAGLGWSHSF